MEKGAGFEARIEACSKGLSKSAKRLNKVFNTNDYICPFSMWFEIKANESETLCSQKPEPVCEFAEDERAAKRINDPQTILHYRPCTRYNQE